MQWYNQCGTKGLNTQTWGLATYQFMHKLKKVKTNLKAWNILGAKENPLSKLQEEFNTTFARNDEDLENEGLFEHMFHISTRLNEHIKKQHELLKQQSKIM